MTIHGSRIYSVLSAVAAAALVLTSAWQCTKKVDISRSQAATSTLPIGQLNTNLDSLRTVIEGLPFGQEHTRKRKLQGSNAGTNVKIRPVGDSHLIDSASGPPVPVIVAWIQNQNLVTATDDPRFKPKPEAQYLVEIFRDAVTSEAKYQLIEVPSSPHGTVSVIKTGVLGPCYHTPAPPWPDADFKSCSGYHEPFAVAPSGAPANYAELSMSSPLFRAASYFRSFFTTMNPLGEDPTWIACNAGCCTLVGT